MNDLFFFVLNQFYTTTFKLLFQIIKLTDNHLPPSGEMIRGVQEAVLVLHLVVQYVTFISQLQ